VTTRGGFTLVELMVALVLTALVALLAAGTFSAASDAARRIREERIAADRAGNGRRWLEAAFLSLEVGQAGSRPFEGHPARVSFTSWLPVPQGWMERMDVRLALAGNSLVATAGAAPPLTLMDSVRSVGIDYLLEPGEASRWASEWVSPVSAPLAIRLRIERPTATDTILCLVKARG
jgi:prepilin-type N-terminal cleavage/methylation domain-containing protein